MNTQAELLQTILKPLLDDFGYWFNRAINLLSDHEIPTLTSDEQTDLLARVTQAHKEVQAAQVLFSSMGGEVGVGMDSVNQWHKLVAECWGVSMAYHRNQQSSDPSL